MSNLPPRDCDCPGYCPQNSPGYFRSYSLPCPLYHLCPYLQSPPPYPVGGNLQGLGVHQAEGRLDPGMELAWVVPEVAAGVPARPAGGLPLRTPASFWLASLTPKTCWGPPKTCWGLPKPVGGPQTCWGPPKTCWGPQNLLGAPKPAVLP